MDKINSELFSSKNLDFDLINCGLQPKLFVNIPNQTQVRGEFNYLTRILSFVFRYKIVYFLFYSFKVFKISKEKDQHVKSLTNISLIGFI